MAKNKDLTQCPYCFAEIDAQARKCCYCGEWVDERGGSAKSSRGSRQAKPAHEVLTEHFDEAVRTESVVFAVIALALFFVWPPPRLFRRHVGAVCVVTVVPHHDGGRGGKPPDRRNTFCPPHFSLTELWVPNS
jgi:hypothetical protein